jgi:hypothetical protein
MEATMIVLFLAMAFAGAAPMKTGYIYDSQVDARAAVFNMVSLLFSFQGRSDAHIEGHSEFSVQFEDCSNEKYFCLVGPVAFVVPKAFNASHWEYHETKCDVVMKNRDPYTIRCRSGASDAATIFTYSLSCGIISFKKSEPGDTTSFLLRGDKGIFSQ